jgi:phenylacetate-CoA ligase
VRLTVEPGRLGWPFARIDGIQGRTEDILHLSGVSGREVAVHPITFHHVLDSLPVSGWQVIQEADGLRVLLSGAAATFADDTLVSGLRQGLAAQGVDVPSIRIQHVPAIPNGQTQRNSHDQLQYNGRFPCGLCDVVCGSP